MADLSAKKAHQIDASQLAKTRLCAFFQEGRCKYGDECTYSHSSYEMRKAPEELRRTKMCDLYLVGRCMDEDCNWAHSEDELRSKKEARRKARASSKPDLFAASPFLYSSRRHSVAHPPRADDRSFELMKQLASLLLSADPSQQAALQASILSQLHISRPVDLLSPPTPPTTPPVTPQHSLLSGETWSIFENPEVRDGELSIELLQGLADLVGDGKPTRGGSVSSESTVGSWGEKGFQLF